MAKESMLRKRDGKLRHLMRKWRHEHVVVEGFVGMNDGKLEAPVQVMEKKSEEADWDLFYVVVMNERRLKRS